MIVNEEQKEKWMKDSEPSLRDLWDAIKKTERYALQEPQRRTERRGQKEYLNK